MSIKTILIIITVVILAAFLYEKGYKKFDNKGDIWIIQTVDSDSNLRFIFDKTGTYIVHNLYVDSGEAELDGIRVIVK